MNGPDRQARELTLGRDMNRCVVCGTYLRPGTWPGVSLHHRRRRSQAIGEAERHLPSNLISVCGTGTTGCHGWIHAHPEQAHAFGWLLTSGDPEPSQTPVYTRRLGWILPDTDGQYRPCPPPEGMSVHPVIPDTSKG